MELRQIHQFIAVAEALNFRRAAERLHMAQPPLSVAMRKLEDDLGTTLFIRGTRGVQLTAAGSAVLTVARRCVADATALREVAQSASSGEHGQLRLGFVGSATYSLIQTLLPLYRARYPKVELSLREGTNLELLEQIERGELDAGLVRYPTALSRHLRFDIVQRDRFCAAVPSSHRLAKSATVTMKMLAGEPFIGYAFTRVPGLHSLAMLVFQQARVWPTVAQQAMQVHTVVSLVQGGFGVALVPSVAARAASPGVAFRRIEDLPAAGEISLALASLQDCQSVLAQRFRELAITTLESDPSQLLRDNLRAQANRSARLAIPEETPRTGRTRASRSRPP